MGNPERERDGGTMPLISMTGYGRGEASAGGMKIEVELSSVNRKQFDVRVSLPKTLMALESRVYEMVHRVVSRGYVMGTVKVSVSGRARQKCVSVDVDTARAYVRGLGKVAKELGLKNDLTARSLVYLPEVVQYESLPEDSEGVWSLLKKALSGAIDQLVEMRKIEGEALEKDLMRRFEELRRHLDHIVKLAPKVAQKYRKILEKRLQQAGIESEPDDQQLMKELVLFVDRSDISEEIVRLQSHFGQVTGQMDSKRPMGRTLDFLCQEMFREINTIGSKANDAAISRHVVQFKADLENIREQVQNVE